MADLIHRYRWTSFAYTPVYYPEGKSIFPFFTLTWGYNLQESRNWLTGPSVLPFSVLLSKGSLSSETSVWGPWRSWNPDSKSGCFPSMYKVELVFLKLDDLLEVSRVIKEYLVQPHNEWKQASCTWTWAVTLDEFLMWPRRQLAVYQCRELLVHFGAGAPNAATNLQTNKAEKGKARLNHNLRCLWVLGFC